MRHTVVEEGRLRNNDTYVVVWIEEIPGRIGGIGVLVADGHMIFRRGYTQIKSAVEEIDNGAPMFLCVAPPPVWDDWQKAVAGYVVECGYFGATTTQSTCNTTTPKTCNCPMDVLMSRGCQCGGE